MNKKDNNLFWENIKRFREEYGSFKFINGNLETLDITLLNEEIEDCKGKHYYSNGTQHSIIWEKEDDIEYSYCAEFIMESIGNNTFTRHFTVYLEGKDVLSYRKYIEYYITSAFLYTYSTEIKRISVEDIKERISSNLLKINN